MTSRVVSYDRNTEEMIAQMNVAGWMNSTSHRENILDESLQREGISVTTGWDDMVCITEDFC